MTSFVFEDLDASRHALRGELTFSTAYAAYSDGVRRLMALGKGAHCEFDCSGLTESDSAGLSVLIEWKGEAARRGIALVYRGLPESLGRLARISDVEALLRAA